MDASVIGNASTHSFMGENGFYWWIGVVERRNDPLQLGRARVRIFGYHSENPDVLPTDELPWALMLMPTNNLDSPKAPIEGSWVVGFYLDGPIAQQPVIIGVIPGYRRKSPALQE